MHMIPKRRRKGRLAWPRPRQRREESMKATGGGKKTFFGFDRKEESK